MKSINKLFLSLNVVVLLILSYFGYFLYRSFNSPDEIVYAEKDVNKSLEYLLLKRSKDFFGGYKYFFSARPLNEESPFIMKYFPVLDTDKDSFDIILSLDACGNDTYVITLRKGLEESYKKFNIFDHESKLIDEKGLEDCKRQRLR